MAFHFCLTIVRGIHKSFRDRRAFSRALQERYNQCLYLAFLLKRGSALLPRGLWIIQRSISCPSPRGTHETKDQIGKSHQVGFLFHLWSLSRHLSSLTNARRFLLWKEPPVVGPARESWWARAPVTAWQPLAFWIVGANGAFSGSETWAALEVSPGENSNNKLLRLFSVHLIY